MTDREVGELWHYWNDHQLDSLPGWWKGKEDALRLIRKFLEERAELLYWRAHDGFFLRWDELSSAAKESHRRTARTSLGIPEEGFKE